MQSPPRWLYVTIGFGCAALGVMTLNPDLDLTRAEAEKILRQYYSDPAHSRKTADFGLNLASFTLRDPRPNRGIPTLSKEQFSDITKLINDALKNEATTYQQLRSEILKGLDSSYSMISFDTELRRLRIANKSNVFKSFYTRQLPYDGSLMISVIGVIKEELQDVCKLVKGSETLRYPACTYTERNILFGGITGMIGSRAEKRVEFKLLYEPTDFATRVAAILGSDAPNLQSFDTYALFSKYDDGWRPTRVPNFLEQ